MANIEQLVQITSDLIRIKSMRANPDQIKKCLDYAADFLADLNLDIQHIESNGVPSLVVTKKGSKNPKVFLCGHMDVVDAPLELFEPIIKDDWLYGRGALDMKSGNAVLLALMKELVNTHDIGLILSGDEEVGGFNGTKVILERGYSCKVALIPDGGMQPNNIMYKSKGVLMVKLSAAGQAAHSSRTWQGTNAIEQLIKGIDRVQSLFMPIPEHPEDHWTTTCNLGTIQGGDSPNMVAANAHAVCDIRFTEDQNPDEIFKRIQSSLPDGIYAEEVASAPCTYVSPDDPYVQTYQKGIRAQNLEPGFTQDHGSSDARFFTSQNIPVIISQPLGKDHHTDNERVHIPSILTYYNIVKDFLDDVALLK